MLKNWSRKWSSESEKFGSMNKGISKLVTGTDNFHHHEMNLYEQIGYIYSHLRMHATATDYFKK